MADRVLEVPSELADALRSGWVTLDPFPWSTTWEASRKPRWRVKSYPVEYFTLPLGSDINGKGKPPGQASGGGAARRACIGSWKPYRGGNDTGALDMLLTLARVRKFKSIDDSGLVGFEPDVTCLVGRNESGKTAFLEALARANPMADDPRWFDELRDYPRALRASERAQVADTVPIAASFELCDADVEALWAEFGPGVVSSREIRPARCTSATTACCPAGCRSRGCSACRPASSRRGSGPRAHCSAWPA